MPADTNDPAAIVAEGAYRSARALITAHMTADGVQGNAELRLVVRDMVNAVLRAPTPEIGTMVAEVHLVTLAQIVGVVIYLASDWRSEADPRDPDEYRIWLFRAIDEVKARLGF